MSCHPGSRLSIKYVKLAGCQLKFHFLYLFLGSRGNSSFIQFSDKNSAVMRSPCTSLPGSRFHPGHALQPRSHMRPSSLEADVRACLERLRSWNVVAYTGNAGCLTGSRCAGGGIRMLLISTHPSEIKASAASFSRSKLAQLLVYLTSMVASGHTERTPRKKGCISADNLSIWIKRPHIRSCRHPWPLCRPRSSGSV